MFIVLEIEMMAFTLSKNYDSNISRHILSSFKNLTMLSLIWSSAPLKVGRQVVSMPGKRSMHDYKTGI